MSRRQDNSAFGHLMVQKGDTGSDTDSVSGSGLGPPESKDVVQPAFARLAAHETPAAGAPKPFLRLTVLNTVGWQWCGIGLQS